MKHDGHDRHDDRQRSQVATASAPTENGDPYFGNVPSAKGCARITALALALIADSRDWMAAQSPQFAAVPLETMALVAFECAAVSPWRTSAELAPCVRLNLWLCLLDDYIEQSGRDLAQVDDIIQRCVNIVRGDGPDDIHWLLTALSSCQRDLVAQPLYRALSSLWIEKFESMLQGMRYECTVAGSGSRDESDVQEYLAHADSIAVGVAQIHRWITYGDDAVLSHLELLMSALGEQVVALRLANDLASLSRDHVQPGNDNILMYGVSPDWVKSEIARGTDMAAQRLAGLVAAQVMPAIELLRELEFVTAFYSLTDFRIQDSHNRQQ
jgi:hypothetical protein